MLRSWYWLALSLSLSAPLVAQDSARNSTDVTGEPAPAIAAGTPAAENLRPFSELALGAGFGAMGFSLQAATNVNRFLNLRLQGNVFRHNLQIRSAGFAANGTLDFASMGASLDYYPWPAHGLRVSPGLLLYNQNALSASATEAPGESFTLNGVTYYSSASDPVRASGIVGLHAIDPAFTLTTGWGNQIPRDGGHWSFPVEAGVAFAGAPSVQMSLTGTACDSTGVYCVDAASNAEIQANLQAQVAKYRSDLTALRTFPIVSFGVSYRFGPHTR